MSDPIVLGLAIVAGYTLFIAFVVFFGAKWHDLKRRREEPVSEDETADYLERLYEGRL